MIKSYGILGESQETRTELGLDAPYILMKSDRPAPHYVATESGEWVEGPHPALSCSKLQGELVLLEEPSPTPEHPTLLHWVEAAVDAEPDPIRKRTMLAYLNAPSWRSDDPLVPVMWQAAGRDLSELPAVFARANSK